jgi:hypothetical protein
MQLEKRGCENYFARVYFAQGLVVQVLTVKVSPLLIRARRDTTRLDPA